MNIFPLVYLFNKSAFEIVFLPAFMIRKNIYLIYFTLNVCSKGEYLLVKYVKAYLTVDNGVIYTRLNEVKWWALREYSHFSFSELLKPKNAFEITKN